MVSKVNVFIIYSHS